MKSHHRQSESSPVFGENTEHVMGFPPGLVRLRPEKTSASPAATGDGKNGYGYDGPSDGYDRLKSRYDKPGVPDGQPRDRYDRPEKGYDGPDQAHGGARPPTPVRR
jgi:hypothetical protein